MRFSKLLAPTLRETPAEAEILSHQLMLRAGLIRKLAAGIYSYLPIGLKTLHKIEAIVRREMDAAGAQELLMGALLPAEYYMKTGRWEVFGAEMFRLHDRNARDFCLGPTHEEVFTQTVKDEVHSYKQLPMTLYQIQTKYRDERRPRFGVMRSREFIMKDAYSFDRDAKGLDASYNAMYAAYCRIFDKMGLDYIVVDADSGAMGGSGSQEYMVKSEVGEDTIAYCKACGYAANEEKAQSVPGDMPYPGGDYKYEKVHTPNIKTIDELTGFLGAPPHMFAKTLIYKADGRLIAAIVRGDREINETKLQNLLACENLEMAGADEVMAATGAATGFAGPIGLDIDIYLDNEAALMKNFFAGANENDYHFKNVNISDFTPKATADLRLITEGDACPKCGGRIETAQGIEVGHIFKLGTKYSDALGLTFLDEDSRENPVIMGCYGIGVNRCMAAVIEQNSDKDGIIWPVAVAPFHVAVVPVNINDSAQKILAEEIYARLLENNIEALFDDRDERPGVKFKDLDLIGIPVRITVGKKAGENIVEYKIRGEGEYKELDAKAATAAAIEHIRAAL